MEIDMEDLGIDYREGIDNEKDTKREVEMTDTRRYEAMIQALKSGIMGGGKLNG